MNNMSNMSKISQLITNYQKKNNVTLFDLALDVGVSESTLYNIKNSYHNVSQNMLNKVEKFFK